MRISDWSSDVCSSDLHRHRPRARLRRHVGRLPQADPDRVRSDHRIRGFELLPVVLQLLRRGCRMSAPDTFAAGFEVPLHRSLTEPILLGGAPRTVAIANVTLAAAVEIGRAHLSTPVTNSHHACRLLLEKQ